MAKNQITKADLSLSIHKEEYLCGTYLHYVGCQDKDLYRIVDIPSDGVFLIARIDLPSFEQKNTHRVSLSDIQQYYKVVQVDIHKLHSLSLRLLDGEEFVAQVQVGDENDKGTSLMHLGDKGTLLALRQEVAKAQQVADMVRRHTRCIIDSMRRKMDDKLRELDKVMSGMQALIERIDYVVQTIETYAGIKENVITLQSGIPADASFPVVVRQAVIYMDEEMALIDPEFDWQKMQSFDQWLLHDNNYKTLLPDVKSIVAIKPRRTDKRYSYGNTAADAYHNWVMNRNNHVTLFLIRNGDNLYRLDSEHIVLADRMFPNSYEYESLSGRDSKWHSNVDETELFRKRYTKVAFLLQGLFERSEVFSPHNFTGSLIKMQGLDGQVELNYELDLTRRLADGRPLFEDWLKQLNANLTEGKRVMMVKAGMNHPGCGFSRRDFVTWYSSDWNTPGYPDDGVYTLYKSKAKGNDKHYEAHHPYIIKFMSTEPSYTWSEVRERKNRTSVHVDLDDGGILNYDDLRIEDIDYYLNSRLHRSQYSRFVVLLSKVKRLLLQEQKTEQDFIGMMVGQMLARGLAVKDGFTPQQVVKKAVDTVKGRLKWKRPVSSKEKETYTLVERTLFSKAYLAKYFKA